MSTRRYQHRTDVPSCRHSAPQLSKERAEQFYGEHAGKPFFPGLVSFMTSGPIWALVLERPGAIYEWRALMGPTNTLVARKEAPHRCVRRCTSRAVAKAGGLQGCNAQHETQMLATALATMPLLAPFLSRLL